MADDVLITPASGKIEFYNSTTLQAKLEIDAGGNLAITNPTGDISVGDTTSDIYVGDGSSNIDIVFEQNGEIRALASKTITLGQSDSYVKFNTVPVFTSGNATYGLSTGLSAEFGVNTTAAGAIKLHGITASAAGIIQATTDNMHIDVVGGNLYLNYYDGSAIMFGSGSSSIVAVMGTDGDLWKGSADNSGSKYWHAGNDGSGSGLDADLWDGNQFATYLNQAVLTTSSPTFKNVVEGVYSLTGTALDPSNGSIQYKTVSANTTFTDSLSSGESLILRLIGAGSYSITWPTIKWVSSTGNSAPTLQSGTQYSVLVFWKEGSTLYGAYIGYST